ncbi:hypothetical protein J6590_104690 [Homalodisca vitripennis]|nr:hypothetical protein J6590_104690 [Homalodisca vitripennis]
MKHGPVCNFAEHTPTCGNGTQTHTPAVTRLMMIRYSLPKDGPVCNFAEHTTDLWKWDASKMACHQYRMWIHHSSDDDSDILKHGPVCNFEERTPTCRNGMYKMACHQYRMWYSNRHMTQQSLKWDASKMACHQYRMWYSNRHMTQQSLKWDASKMACHQYRMWYSNRHMTQQSLYVTLKNALRLVEMGCFQGGMSPVPDVVQYILLKHGPVCNFAEHTPTCGNGTQTHTPAVTRLMMIRYSLPKDGPVCNFAEHTPTCGNGTLQRWHVTSTGCGYSNRHMTQQSLVG